MPKQIQAGGRMGVFFELDYSTGAAVGDASISYAVSHTDDAALRKAGTVMVALLPRDTFLARVKAAIQAKELIT